MLSLQGAGLGSPALQRRCPALSSSFRAACSLQAAARPHLACSRRQRRRRQCGARASASASAAEETDGAYCMPAYVSADNERSKCFTVLDVEVGDYPGLLRVISWTLNGLDVCTQNAVVRTSEDGQAHNTFWLTKRGTGRKLTDAEAELLADRVRDFVTYCSPDQSHTQASEFTAGPIEVSNSQHEHYTVVSVREPRPTPGFLLEVASALSGMNMQICQGVVQGAGCEGDPLEVGVEAELDEGKCLKEGAGRIFKFWVRDSRGGKLDYGTTSALVYTLSSVLGYRSHPTVPPDQEMLVSAR